MFEIQESNSSENASPAQRNNESHRKRQNQASIRRALKYIRKQNKKHSKRASLQTIFTENSTLEMPHSGILVNKPNSNVSRHAASHQYNNLRPNLRYIETHNRGISANERRSSLPDQVDSIITRPTISSFRSSDYVVFDRTGMDTARKSKQFFSTFIISLGGIMVGNMEGWPDAARSFIPDLIGDVVGDTRGRDRCIMWLAAVSCLSAACAQFLALLSMESIGRKWSIVAFAIGSVFGWLVIAFTNSFAVLVVGRLILGFTAGALYVICPIFMMEVSTRLLSTMFCVYYHFTVVIGRLYMCAFQYFGNRLVFSLMPLVLPAVLVCLIQCIPRSPVFLVKKGKQLKALRALNYFLGSEYDCLSKYYELQRLHGEITGWRMITCLKNRNAMRAIFIVTLMVCIKQLSGMGIFRYRLGLLLQIEHVTVLPTRHVLLVVGCSQALVTLLAAVVIIKRVNRKLLWYVSLNMMLFSLMLLGLCYSIQFQTDNKDPVTLRKHTGDVLPLGAIIMLYAGYSVGGGPMWWAMMCELLNDQNFATTVIYIGCFVNWLLQFVMAISIEYLHDLVRYDTKIYFFALMCCFWQLVVLLFFIETNEKEPIQIKNELGTKSYFVLHN